MAKLLGELLFEILGSLIRSSVRAFLEQAILMKFATWLDSNVQGRTLKIILGLLLGIVAYFLIPILMALFPI
jgi:hypothetical protein